VISQALPPEPHMIAVLKAVLARFPFRDARVQRYRHGYASYNSTTEVGALLTDMEKRGLVQVVQRHRGVRAVITAQGREALVKASS
jgi:hypothetical protein